MGIEKICIKNFRAYNGEYTFKLDKNLTIFYGENGFGKSSFFDAIEWCLTGNINRFQSDGNLTFDKLDIINRLNRNHNSDCYVSISFDNGNTLLRQFSLSNGEPQRINVKIINSEGHTIISGESKVSQFLKDFYIKNNNVGNELLGSLIKQTHILSQDEVADFVLRDDPKERYKSLATIMGLKPVMNLTRNLKIILSKLNALIDDENSRIEQQVETIKSYSSKMEKIDETKFKNILKRNLLNINTDDFEGQIKKKNQEAYQKQAMLNEKLQVFNSIMKNGYNSCSELISKEKFLREKLKDQVALEMKLNSLNHRMNGKVNRLNQRILSLPNLEELTQNQLELKNEIKQIVFDIKSRGYSPKITLEYLASQINQVVTDRKRTAYILAYIDEYLKAKELIDILPQAILEQKEKLAKYSRTSERLDKVLIKLSTQSTNDNFIADTANLLNSLKSILEYTENHNNNGICPVCSATHGNNLLGLMQSNIEEQVKSLSENKERVVKLSGLIKKVKKNIESNKKNITEIEFTITQINEQLDEQRNIVLRIESNNYFIGSLFNKSKNDLFMLKNEYEQREKNLKHVKDMQVKLNQLKIDYKNICNEIRNNKISIDLFKLNKTLKRIQKEKRIIKLITIKLENIVTKLRINLSSIEAETKQLLTFINNNDEVNDNIKELIIKTESEINCIRLMIIDFEYVSSEYLKIKLNRKIEGDINELINKISNEKSDLEKLNQYLELVNKWLESLYETFGEHAMEFVNKPNSSIQKYYRYLNPVPSSDTQIQFTAVDERLNIQIRNGNDDYLENARYTLSSAQLNVLAIAIFLAMNDSELFTNLDFVAIDDPIQNMDDVNQFSLCDILINLNKQVIFSTHDLDFIKLYIKKNEHRNKSIKVYVLKSAYLTPEKIESLDFPLNQK